MTRVDWSKAPDWATKRVFIGPTGGHSEVWADEDIYQYDAGAQYKFRDNGGSKQCTLIETRPIAETVTDWMPKVGEECECHVWTNFNGGEKQWVVKVVIGHSSSSMCRSVMNSKPAVIIDSSQVEGKFIACDEFRPIKTEAEKEREAFIESANEAIDVEEFALSEINVVRRTIAQLAKAKFIAPKGGE